MWWLAMVAWAGADCEPFDLDVRTAEINDASRAQNFERAAVDLQAIRSSLRCAQGPDPLDILDFWMMGVMNWLDMGDEERAREWAAQGAVQSLADVQPSTRDLRVLDLLREARDGFSGSATLAFGDDGVVDGRQYRGGSQASVAAGEHLVWCWGMEQADVVSVEVGRRVEVCPAERRKARWELIVPGVAVTAIGTAEILATSLVMANRFDDDGAITDAENASLSVMNASGGLIVLIGTGMLVAAGVMPLRF